MSLILRHWEATMTSVSSELQVQQDTAQFMGEKEYRTKKEESYLRPGQSEFWLPELHPDTGI